MKTVLRLLGGLLIAAIAATLIMFVAANNDDKKYNDNLESVTIAQWGQEKYLIYLPLYIAQEKGFFEDEGVKVNVKYSGNDDQVFASVIKGDADFGVGDPIFAAISKEKGGNGKVVANIVNGVALWGIAKNNFPIDNVKKKEDLAGLRIGTFPKPSTTYTLIKNTIKSGGDRLSDTKIVEATFGAQIALLESNSADIVMELEPGASIAESKGYKIVYSLPSFYGDFSFTGLTTTDNVINKKPIIVQKTVNALERACTYAHKDIEGAISVATKLFPDLESKVIANAVHRMLSDETIPNHVFISDEGWSRTVKIRRQVGDLNSDGKNVVDNSFAIKAKK